MAAGAGGGYACSVALALFGAGIAAASLWLVPTFVNRKVLDGLLVTSNQSATYAAWVDSSDEFVSYYLFNITNPAAFARGAPPALQELGPFTYQYHRKKLDVVFDAAADTVEYFRQDTYTFRPDLSAFDSDAINVTTVDLGFWAAQATANASSDMQVRDGVLFGLVTAGLYPDPDSKLASETHTARELLFGFRSRVLAGISAVAKQEGQNVSAIFPGLQSHSDDAAAARADGRWRSRIGATDADAAGRLLQWRGRTEMRVCAQVPCPPHNDTLAWGTAAASAVTGSDGRRYAPGMAACSAADTWVDSLARVARLENVGCETATVHDISLLRLRIPDSLLQTAAQNPANAAYFMRDHRGLIPLSRVNALLPIFATKPHFLDTDAYLQGEGARMGLAPDAAKHDTYVDVEPISGINMRSRERLMFSVRTQAVAFPPNLLTTIYDGYVPVLWADDHGQINEDDARKFKDSVYLARDLVFWLRLGGGLLGALLLAGAAALALRTRARRSGARGDAQPLLVSGAGGGYSTAAGRSEVARSGSGRGPAVYAV